VKVVKALYENGLSKMLLVNDDYELIEESLLFSNYLYVAGYSPNTIDGYLRDIKSFFQFLQTRNIKFTLVKPIDIIAFIQYLNSNIKMCEKNDNLALDSATINRKLAGIASFYKYHEKITGLVKSPFVNLVGHRSAEMAKGFLFHISNKKVATKNYIKQKKTKILVQRLTKEQVLFVCEEFDTPHMQLIFKVLYNSDIRIGELLGLRVTDYEDPRQVEKVGCLYIIARASNSNHQRQKTGDRVVHIPKEILIELDEYVTTERHYIQDVDHIFVAMKGKTKGYPLTRDAIEKAFRKCSRKTGINFTPHCLRHTHFTELAEAGFDEQYIKARGGWSNILFSNAIRSSINRSPEKSI